VRDHFLERPARVGQQIPPDDHTVDLGGEGQVAGCLAPGSSEGDQTGVATKQPRSGSLKDSSATSSFIGLAVPHWSVTSGREKS